MFKPEKKTKQQEPNQQPPTTPATEPVIELTDTALEQVTGGHPPDPIAPVDLGLPTDPSLTPPDPI